MPVKGRGVWVKIAHRARLRFRARPLYARTVVVQTVPAPRSGAGKEVRMEPRDVFISYIEEDAPTARELAKQLRGRGHSTWTYEQDGVAGISYLTQVNRAIEACRAFVLIASAKSVRAHQVIREVEQAHERAKVIIPVRVGLSHQQFTSADPILRMASGTAVSLSVTATDFRDLAARIGATLTFLQESEPPVVQPIPAIMESG